MATFKTKNAIVLYSTSAPATDFSDGGIAKTNCKIIGVCKSESGFKVSPDEQIKDTASNDIVLSYKGEIDITVLSELTSGQVSEIDGKTISVLFLDPTGVTIPDAATSLGDVGVVLPATPKAIMLTPMVINIEENYKYGTGKVDGVKVMGNITKSTKAELRKEVTIEVA